MPWFRQILILFTGFAFLTQTQAATVHMGSSDKYILIKVSRQYYRSHDLLDFTRRLHLNLSLEDQYFLKQHSPSRLPVLAINKNAFTLDYNRQKIKVILNDLAHDKVLINNHLFVFEREESLRSNAIRITRLLQHKVSWKDISLFSEAHAFSFMDVVGGAMVASIVGTIIFAGGLHIAHELVTPTCHRQIAALKVALKKNDLKLRDYNWPNHWACHLQLVSAAHPGEFFAVGDPPFEGMNITRYKKIANAYRPVQVITLHYDNHRVLTGIDVTRDLNHEIPTPEISQQDEPALFKRDQKEYKPFASTEMVLAKMYSCEVCRNAIHRFAENVRGRSINKTVVSQK